MKIIKNIFYSIICVITSHTFAATSLPLCNLIDLKKIEYPCFGVYGDLRESSYFIGELQDGVLHGQGIKYSSWKERPSEIGEFRMGILQKGNIFSVLEKPIPEEALKILNAARSNSIDTTTLTRLWDGIERRKQAIMAIRKEKSKLPICDGPPEKWDNCFQIIRRNYVGSEELYSGEFQSGKKNGKGVFLRICSESNCIKEYHGLFKDGSAYDENGAIFYDSGDIYFGRVKDWERDGQGLYQFKDNTTFHNLKWQPSYYDGRTRENQSYPTRVGIWKFPKGDSYLNEYFNGFPIFNFISCLKKPESRLVEKLGVPNKFYELSGKKYLSYTVTHNYSSQIADACFISYDLVFTLTSGTVVDAKRLDINFGRGFNSCSGFWNTDFSIREYGCY